ncbi:hypothetical protein [Winogradskyella bathintestinalis]|uniref:Uncharacterized protein n=1 Tax=Winogradskyella bathintestinalis TaxID=3035208 RepID=A0ABT7ZSI5_9FLAO|nr:hypothetical protein [Winogradskyella bathintestinalis]MDN3491708.1 hypothetical protein [Winogradskyella bathintestinalis]
MKKLLKEFKISIVAIILVTIVFWVYLYCKYDEKLLLGIIGVIATLYFGITKTQIEKNRFFQKLFNDFNLNILRQTTSFTMVRA